MELEAKVDGETGTGRKSYLEGGSWTLGDDHLLSLCAPHFLACPAYAEWSRTGHYPVELLRDLYCDHGRN